MKKYILLFLFILISCKNTDYAADIYDMCDSSYLYTSMVLGNDGDSIYFAGVVDAFLRSESELIVIEANRQQVTEVDLSSLRLQIIGQHGLGPHEYNTPVVGCIMNDGAAIAIADNSKILIYQNNSVRKAIPVENMFAPMDIIQYTDSTILAKIIQIKARDGEIIGITTVQHLGGMFDEEVLWSYSEMVIDVTSLNDFINLVYYGPMFTVDSEYNIYITERDSRHYEIAKLDRYGNYSEIVSNYFSPVQKSDIQIQDEKYVMETFANAIEVTGPPITWIPKSEFNLISGIDLGPDGNIWARRGYSTQLTYDIFNTDGLYIRTIVLAEDYDCTFWTVHINQYGLVAYDLRPELSDQVYIIKYREDISK